MMSHRPASTPCVGEPCPCHHGSDSSVLPDVGGWASPSGHRRSPRPQPWTSRATPSDLACAAGFPSSVFHPPHLAGGQPHGPADRPHPVSYLLMDAIWGQRRSIQCGLRGAGAGFVGDQVKTQAYSVHGGTLDDRRVRTSGVPTPRSTRWARTRRRSPWVDESKRSCTRRLWAVKPTAAIGTRRRCWPARHVPSISSRMNIDGLGSLWSTPGCWKPMRRLILGGRFDHMTGTADPTRANLALYAAYHGTTATSRTDVMPSGRAKLTYQVRPDREVAAAVGQTARVAEANERFYACVGWAPVGRQPPISRPHSIPEWTCRCRCSVPGDAQRANG